MTPAVAGMRGPEIPGFRWVRPLGQGGFADVFLYRQELPSREVAIKVVRTQGDERGTKELHREADAMTLLAGHPAVVELHGVGTTADGRAYLVMEYCPVADLLTQVRARPMSLEKALDTMITVCGGVEMFHRQGYVHRDIKPSNIMLDSYGKPVLADFGVASKVGQLEVGAFDGFSVLWAPPEQQDVNSPASPLQDVWALAATTWTFVTGRSPFEDPIGDNSAASIANRVQRGRMRGLGRADAPAELERVLRAAMTIDPQERTQSAMEFGQGLQRVQKELGLPRTEMEIKEKRSKASTAVSGDQKTRLRGAPVIDPDKTRLRSSASYSFEGGAGSGGVEAVGFLGPQAGDLARRGSAPGARGGGHCRRPGRGHAARRRIVHAHFSRPRDDERVARPRGCRGGGPAAGVRPGGGVRRRRGDVDVDGADGAGPVGYRLRLRGHGPGRHVARPRGDDNGDGGRRKRRELHGDHDGVPLVRAHVRAAARVCGCAVMRVMESVEFYPPRRIASERGAGHVVCRMVSIARGPSRSTQLKDEGTCL